jgi:hypothetical protein
MRTATLAFSRPLIALLALRRGDAEVVVHDLFVGLPEALGHYEDVQRADEHGD